MEPARALDPEARRATLDLTVCNRMDRTPEWWSCVDSNGGSYAVAFGAKARLREREELQFSAVDLGDEKLRQDLRKICSHELSLRIGGNTYLALVYR